MSDRIIRLLDPSAMEILMPLPRPRPFGRSAASTLAAGLLVAGCAVGAPSASPDGSSSASGASSSPSTTTTQDVLASAAWGENVEVTLGDTTIEFASDGIPNHSRQAEYAVPNDGVRVPDASTAHAVADPTVAQNYAYALTTAPTFAAAPTDTSLGAIGLMISGATLFNPYEGDGSTVATASNFSIKNAQGEDVWFLDDCSGHPTPMGQYHYHALPACVTAMVDDTGGASHIIGVALDGFPIYGDRDVSGNAVTAAQLDVCNGITSPTPEFPDGIYHYVLLPTSDSRSSIGCLAGVVDASLVSMGGMQGMPKP